MDLYDLFYVVCGKNTRDLSVLLLPLEVPRVYSSLVLHSYDSTVTPTFEGNSVIESMKCLRT